MALDINAIAGTATAATVLVAVAFGILQMRQFARQRRDAAAIELVRSLQTPEFTRAVQLVFDLGTPPDPEAVASNGELRSAFMTIDWTVESMGVLVHRRVVPVDILDDLAGGFVRYSWRMTGPYWKWLRAKHDYVNAAEWFEWLADRLAALDRPEKRLGAHVAYREWTP